MHRRGPLQERDVIVKMTKKQEGEIGEKFEIESHSAMHTNI